MTAAITPEVLPEVRRPVGRPASVTLMVPNRSLPERVKTINEYHRSACEAMRDAAAYAVMCGLELLAAKGATAHGSWERWVENNCEFSIETGKRYMRLADRLSQVGALKRVLAELPGGQVQTKGDRVAVAKAVSELTQGEELKQLYFDYGILREPAGVGGAREGAGRPTREEYQRKIAANVDAEWDSISKPLYRFITEQRYLYMAADRQQTIVDVLRGCVDMVDKTLKRGK
jgi:hypothetical protein